MAYPTRADLVDASSVEALTSLTEPQQDALYVGAIAAIEGYCQQSFTDDGELTRVLDGTGHRDYIWLPRRLEELSQLSVAGSSLDASDVALNEDHSRLSVAADLDSGWYEKAIRDDAPPKFQSGAGIVSITGTWGWPESPEAINTAIRKDMEDSALADSNLLSDSLRAYHKLGVGAISEGPLQATLGDTQSLSTDVIELIYPYTWQQAGALV